MAKALTVSLEVLVMTAFVGVFVFALAHSDTQPRAHAQEVATP